MRCFEESVRVIQEQVETATPEWKTLLVMLLNNYRENVSSTKKAIEAEKAAKTVSTTEEEMPF